MLGVPYLWQTIFESARYTDEPFSNGLNRTQYIYIYFLWNKVRNWVYNYAKYEIICIRETTVSSSLRKKPK